MENAALPSYALFGHSTETELSAGFHVERVSSRLALHNGTVVPHRHPHLHQLTFWIAGTGVYILEEERQPVNPGMLCWVPVGRIHGFSVEAGSDAIVISMAREHVDGHLTLIERRRGEQVLLNPCIIHEKTGVASDLAGLFAMAERAYLASGWGCQEAIGAVASLVFIEIGRRLAERGELESGAMLKTSLFSKLQTCVERRFHDHPSVADLAIELGTTPYLLNQACQSVAGVHVSVYVRRRILREAERLLLFTVSGMAEIAELTGFSDPSHFARAFKTHHGETPRNWRAKAVEGR